MHKSNAYIALGKNKYLVLSVIKTTVQEKNMIMAKIFIYFNITVVCDF